MMAMSARMIPVTPPLAASMISIMLAATTVIFVPVGTNAPTGFVKADCQLPVRTTTPAPRMCATPRSAARAYPCRMERFVVKAASAAAVFAGAPPIAKAKNVATMAAGAVVEAVMTGCGALMIAAMLANAPMTWSCLPASLGRIAFRQEPKTH